MLTRTSIKAVALCALMIPFVTACATRGYVRDRVAAERMSIDSSVASSIATERTARENADSELRSSVDQLRATTDGMRGDIAALRNDLTTLRNEFNVEITQLRDGMKFSMPVTFNFDDAAVREEDKAVLDRFANVLNNHYAGSRVTVEGFADPAGSASYNLRLSKQRADNVRDYLASKGIASGVVHSIGYGEARPVVAGASKNQPGAELNRRVVFVIESRPGAITLSELAVVPPIN